MLQRVNIKNKIEEEEKEKLLKLQQEWVDVSSVELWILLASSILSLKFYSPFFFCREEELQLQKLKKRKIKADPRLSFADEFENDNEEEDEENGKPVSIVLLDLSAVLLV